MLARAAVLIRKVGKEANLAAKVIGKENDDECYQAILAEANDEGMVKASVAAELTKAYGKLREERLFGYLHWAESTKGIFNVKDISYSAYKKWRGY